MVRTRSEVAPASGIGSVKRRGARRLPRRVTWSLAGAVSLMLWGLIALAVSAVAKALDD